ncbi:MAG: HNH endonuclease [Planctomycetaceae bacterium]|nr:HNH endonuclease [Planctomycetaceae bacterium]
MTAYVAAELRARVRELFENRCAYCQTAESLTVTVFEIEHIVPRSKGGATMFENLCLACPSCNRYKSDRLVGRLDTGSECRLFDPHKDSWHDHFGWSIDGTVIVGLTDIAKTTIITLRMNRPQMTSVRELWVDAGRHPPT